MEPRCTTCVCRATTETRCSPIGRASSLVLRGGRGEDVILNRHYQTIHTVTPGNGSQSQGADEHEFIVGHEGKEATAFIAPWQPRKPTSRPLGAPQTGSVYDWIIQEIDIATGKVIWEWHALGHVPVSDSYLPYAPGADIRLLPPELDPADFPTGTS